jgi:hypothetical protein
MRPPPWLLLLAGPALATRRHLAAFPACLTDSDCGAVSRTKGADYKCFQSMCFPWDRTDLTDGFQSCTKRSQCQAEAMKTTLGQGQGHVQGQGQGWDCFRHSDRRKVFQGVCLPGAEMAQCFTHSDCSQGLHCVNGYCGQKDYFQVRVHWEELLLLTAGTA